MEKKDPIGVIENLKDCCVIFRYNLDKEIDSIANQRISWIILILGDIIIMKYPVFESFSQMIYNIRDLYSGQELFMRGRDR